MPTITGFTTTDIANYARNSWLWQAGEDFGWVGWDDGYSGTEQQKITFHDQNDDLYIELDDDTWPRFQGMMWHLSFDYDGPTFSLDIANNDIEMTISVSQSSVSVTTGWVSATELGMGFRTDTMNGNYPYFRIVRNRWPNGCQGLDTNDMDRIEVQFSENGHTWVGIEQLSETEDASEHWWLNAATTGYPIVDFDQGGHWNMHITVGGYMDILSVEGVTVGDHLCDTDDGSVHTEDPDNDIPDTYVPYVPPDADPASKTCTSLLDLIRQFSADVRRPVRIIDGNTIAMVPTTETIPAGFRNSYADRYYVEDEQDLSANTTVLAANRGKLDLTGRAKFKTDEDLILTTDWQMPQRLPFRGLKNAPVMRVSYTMTPKHFTCEVEFAFPQVPSAVTR